MALRATRTLNSHETRLVQAFSDQIRLSCDYEHGVISRSTFEIESGRVTSILGAGWLVAADLELEARRWSAEDINELAYPGKRIEIVRLFDAIQKRARANAAKAYLRSLRNNPQELADVIRAATGAEVVSVGLEGAPVALSSRLETAPLGIDEEVLEVVNAGNQPKIEERTFNELLTGPARLRRPRDVAQHHGPGTMPATPMDLFEDLRDDHVIGTTTYCTLTHSCPAHSRQAE